METKNKRILIVLSLLTLVLIALYMLINLNFNILYYQLPTRIHRVIAIIIVGTAIGVSTVLFQTITKNRILTPSIMGLDSVYVFMQTIIIFVLGASSPLLVNAQLNYFTNMIALVIFTVLVFKYLFKFVGNQVFLLLLVGIILGTFFNSLASFIQMIINPDEFLILQGSLFASFNAINDRLIVITGIVVLVIVVIIFKDNKTLDVMGLGRDQAVNLGVNYDKKISQYLFMIAILVSASTALVGPIMFLGLLIVNLAYEVFKTFRHNVLLIGTSLLGIITLLLGQTVTQHVFSQTLEISVLINLVGGIYFILLMLRESSK